MIDTETLKDWVATLFMLWLLIQVFMMIQNWRKKS